MKYARYLLAVSLLAFTVQARASFTVDDIYNNVIDIWNTVTGDVKDTAQELKQQLTALKDKGQTARETVQDILDFLQHRRQPLVNFVYVGGDMSNPRCGTNSPCANFRTDLEDFVLDIADLKSKFPQIEKHGLGDGTIIIDIIDYLPPIALFSVYEIFQRVPDWQDIPQNLSDLYDEIGDPDAFSLEAPGPTAVTATSAATRASAATAAQTASLRRGQGYGYGSSRHGTEDFCFKHGQGRKDPVRGNRLKAFLTHAKNLVEGIAEFMPEEKTIVAAGEGTSVKIPLQASVKGVAGAIDSIGSQLETYYSNLEQCKKIETDVAACTKLIEYRTDDGNRKAYWVVKGVEAAQCSYPNCPATVESALGEAGNRYAASDFRGAYQRICDAYTLLYAAQ
jgi:hypothetical protein